METIREKAKRELSEWFAKSVKEEILEKYRILRSFGFKASIALTISKQLMTDELNQMMETNFYAGLPH